MILIMTNPNVLYLIYDAECLICHHCAKSLKLKKAVGHLETINARTAHPLVEEARAQGYDLNEGIIVKYQNVFYYGPDAVHFLAMLSTPIDIFNKINAYIFKFKFMVLLIYPILKIIRKSLLWVRQVERFKK